MAVLFSCVSEEVALISIETVARGCCVGYRVKHYYFTLNNSSARKQTIHVSTHNKNSLNPADLSRVL